MKRYLALFVIPALNLLLNCPKGYSQSADNFINGLSDNINAYFMEQPHDNIFVHTDRSVYFSGEELMFTAFVTDAATLRPSTRSDECVLLLADGNGNEIISTNYDLQGGLCYNSFLLPSNLTQGLYSLVGYVLSDGQITANKVFNKEILITDPENQLMIDYTLDKNSYKPGDEAAIQLNAYGSGAKPVSKTEISYTVFFNGASLQTGIGKSSKDGTFVIRFQVPEGAAGSLRLDVHAEKRKLTQQFSILVPLTGEGNLAAGDAGLVGQANAKSTVQIEVLEVTDKRIRISTGALPEGIDKNQKVVVAVFRKGLLYWSAPGMLAQTKELALPVSRIPSGVLNIVLFSGDGDILAEKLLCFERTTRPTVSVLTDRERYGNRQQVKATIALSGLTSEELEATTLSVSVVPKVMNPSEDIFLDDYMLIETDIQQDGRKVLAELRQDPERMAGISRLLDNSDRNGYDWSRILGLKEVEEERISEVGNNKVASGGYGILPEWFGAAEMSDLSRGIKDKRFPNAEEMNYKRQLENGMAVLDVIKSMKPFTLDGNRIIFAGTNNSINYQQGALIVIDNQQVGEDASVLNTLAPSQVESIFISTNPGDIHQYTGLNVVGIIEITMKGYGAGSRFSTETSRDQVVRNAAGSYLPGYPDYSITNDMTSVTSDFRTLIFWDPDIEFTANPDTAEIEFYTPDYSGTFLIKVQGMAGMNPVAVQQEITVR